MRSCLRKGFFIFFLIVFALKAFFIIFFLSLVLRWQQVSSPGTGFYFVSCVASVCNRVIARKLERELLLVPTFSANLCVNACYASYIHFLTHVHRWNIGDYLFTYFRFVSCSVQLGFFLKKEKPHSKIIGYVDITGSTMCSAHCIRF